MIPYFQALFIQRHGMISGLMIYGLENVRFRLFCQKMWALKKWCVTKVVHCNYAFVVSVLLPISCHIGWGMPNLFIFVEDVVMFLCAIIVK